jgi:hypothetical protein
MTIEFAQMSSTETQTPTDSSPVRVRLNQNDELYGIEHDLAHPEDIRIRHSGVYTIIAAPQIGRTKGSDSRYIDVWLNRNGENIPNSNVRKVIGNGGETDVIVSQNMVTLQEGDVINVMMNVETNDEGLGIYAIKPKDEHEPLIPSIILSMCKIQDQTHYFYRKGSS